MKVYLECPPAFSRGIKRVVAALRATVPVGVTVVADRHEADLIVHHVVGVQNFCETPLPALIAQDDRPYAIVQYCARTTEQPIADWVTLWAGARVVWSYYDLQDLAGAPGAFRLYRAPLGVDATVFKPSPLPRKPFVAGTSGYVADTESVREVTEAARAVGGQTVHLGPDLGVGSTLTLTGVSDAELADAWSQCRYVSGLRRVEGFELPALEGLACGARPLLFDRPDDRWCYGEHAEYVPEVAPGDLVPILTDLFRRPVRPVTADELAAVRARYDWGALCRRFWEEAL